MEQDVINKETEIENQGWSKYQLLVLQSMDDHNKMVKSLFEKTNSIDQRFAVFEATQKMWRESHDQSIATLRKDVEELDEKNRVLDGRITTLEQEKKIDSQSSIKVKAFWGALGGAAIVLIELGMKLFDFFMHYVAHKP